VEDAAVDDHVELPAEPVEVESVGGFKRGSDSALLGLGASSLDGALGYIHASGLGTVLCGQERLFAGSTSDIEHLTLQLAGAGKLDEGRLRAADVPWRRALVGAVPGWSLDDGA
jgi:hypothetical protein